MNKSVVSMIHVPDVRATIDWYRKAIDSKELEIEMLKVHSPLG